MQDAYDDSAPQSEYVIADAAMEGGNAVVPDYSLARLNNASPLVSTKGSGSRDFQNLPVELQKRFDEEAKAQKRKILFVQVCYLSLGSMAGALLRIILAQLFGEECANPGTVGWLAASAPLCVTKNGEATQEGGVVFADLPSNMLGCFLMGLFQDGAVLGLALPLAVAWLSPSHSFQQMGILHTAFKTGFCGSLTTYSSWNSEMIVIMFGTGINRQSQIWQALFGYIIGIETALGSFVFGKSVARQLHRMVNPVLAAEADAAEERRLEGVYLNLNLPDFERRFLPNLQMGVHHGDLLPLEQVAYLERWRSSTNEARRVGHPLLRHLIEIEDAVLSQHSIIPSDAISVARAQGWDVDSLLAWVSARSKDLGCLPSVSTRSQSFPMQDPLDIKWLTPNVAGFFLVLILMVLLLCLFLLNGEHAHTVTYRTMVFATLVAPSGALLRWKLSNWNGKLSVEGWSWFPLGTYTANILGCAVSIACMSAEYHTAFLYTAQSGFWLTGSLRAIKVGFAGSLTTVSTFISEINGLMKGQGGHAYPYILISLGSSCALGSIIFAVVAY